MCIEIERYHVCIDSTPNLCHICTIHIRDGITVVHTSPIVITVLTPLTSALTPARKNEDKQAGSIPKAPPPTAALGHPARSLSTKVIRFRVFGALTLEARFGPMQASAAAR